MSYLGKVDMNDADIKHYSLTGSTLTTVDIGWVPPSEQSLRVTINGVVQQGGTFSLSGSNLTLGGALVATDDLEVVGIQSVGNLITPADNSVTLAKMADGTQGGIIHYGASGAPTELAAGTSGYFLKTQGAGANPVWGAVSGEDSIKVLSKAANYTILDTDVDDIGTLYVLVDASAATRTITLPAPADYNGVVIKVIASVAPGTGYSVIVNNSGGSEIWTCYAIGDFYTGISDGTSNIKADGKVSVRGKIYSSVNQTPTGRAYVKTTYDTSKYDVGGWGDLTNNRINVAFDCMISVMSVVNSEASGHPTIYVDSTNQMDTHDSTYESSGFQREVTFVQKVLASQTPIEMYYFVDYSGVRTMRGGEYKIYSTWEVLERI
jgi:hypothetical protein